MRSGCVKRAWVAAACGGLGGGVGVGCGAAWGQSFQSSGTDFSPVNVGGKVAINGHDDPSGLNFTNVRVSAYAFAVNPEDPNFTQDPGFNTPAAGLPGGATVSFSVLDSLKYFSGAGVFGLGAPAGDESLKLTFGPISAVTLTGASGAQAGLTSGVWRQTAHFIST